MTLDKDIVQKKETPSPEHLLSKKEIAFRIGKSPRTVSRWARSGMLPEPAKVVGRREYWLVSQIVIFVQLQDI